MRIQECLFHRSIEWTKDEPAEIRAFLGEAPGIFVDVGAHEPIAGSQSHHLEQAGWSGILVEPLPDFARRLRAHRRARVFEVAAGAPEDDGQERPFILAGELSTLAPHTVVAPELHATVGRVLVRTLDSMLAETGIEQVDFISIDVEEAQHAVLRGFSIGRFRPRLMLVEDHFLSLDAHRLLKASGYKLVRRSNLNNWYVPRTTRYPLSLFGRLQFLRKLHLGRALRRAKLRRSIARKPKAQPAAR